MYYLIKINLYHIKIKHNMEKLFPAFSSKNLLNLNILFSDLKLDHYL